MRLFFSTMTAVLVIFTVIGCTDNLNTPQTQAEADKYRSSTQGANDSVTSSVSKKYSVRSVVPLQVNEDTLSWQEGKVAFAAELTGGSTQGEDTSAAEIGTMLVTSGNTKIKLELQSKPTSIATITLSADQRYLAMHYQHFKGYKLVIVDLVKGQYYPLNDYLSRNGRGSVEIIHSYAWAPQGHSLAIAYGDQNRSSVALYNPDNKMLMDIATPVLYPDTRVILWGKEGKGFDFVTEAEDETKVLYRYVREGNMLEKVRLASPEQLEVLQSLSPTFAK